MVSNFFLCIWIILCLSIIYSDCKYRLIYNYQICLGLFLTLFSSFIYDYELNLNLFFITLAVGFLLWSFRLVGGGDVKLLMVYDIGFNLEQFSTFLLFMSVIGLIVTLIVIIKKSKKGVPYGPVISISHLLIFLIYVY